MRRALAIAILCGLGLIPATARATWSIVAVDPATQEVGVAVASCVEAPAGTTVLPQVPALAPGIGALAAQALFSQARRDDALAFLQMGLSPQQVIDMTNAGDGQPQNRQYGVVVLSGDHAAFTGANAQDWAGDMGGPNVSAQGNILYGPQVVADALAAFEAEPRRCPWTLADRLMVALEAGAAQGGDNRCSMEQSALAAVIQVARPGDRDDAFWLDLRVPSQPEGGDNPVVLLRAEYDAWRLDHPPDDGACVGGSSSGDGAGADSTGAATSTSNGTTAADGGTDAGPTPPTEDPSTTTRASTGSDASSDGTPPQDGGGGGCTCRTGPGPTRHGWAWWLVALGLGRWRRRSVRPEA